MTIIDECNTRTLILRLLKGYFKSTPLEQLKTGAEATPGHLKVDFMVKLFGIVFLMASQSLEVYVKSIIVAGATRDNNKNIPIKMMKIIHEELNLQSTRNVRYASII